ncbi:hypothetical protein PLICRDRAFT_106023, partial [Plicaturopsis crispa FD-325 SS-3]
MNPVEYSIAASENGWTDDHLSLEWFKQVFVPTAQARNKTRKQILVLWDGHGSHETHAIREHAIANGIDLFAFPSHCTHKLQPLDVMIFGPLQRVWAARCDTLADIGQIITKENLIDEYLAARDEVIRPSVIRSAFKKTGIQPFDPTVFGEQDYMPSYETSVIAHFPNSYP